MLIILLILTAVFAVLTWKDLHAGLLLLVAILPSYLLRTEIFGIPTTLLELLVVTYLLVWSIKFLGSRRLKPATNPTTKRKLKPAASVLPVLLLLLASTISIFIAPNLINALGVWKAYFLEPILLFFILRHELIHNNLKPQKIFEALGATAILLSVVGIVQWLTGAGLPIPWDIERRVTSLFDYPNALGLFLGPIVVIGFVQTLTYCRWIVAGGTATGFDRLAQTSEREPSTDRACAATGPASFWIVVTILSCIAIILAKSEAAIVSIIATLLIAGFLHRKTRVLSLNFVVLSLVTALVFPPIFQKLTLQDYSGSVRLSQWSETVDMLQDHWLLGAGLSGYPTVFEPYHQATHLEIFQYPHNLVLNIWVELGLLGLIALGWLGYLVLLSLRGGQRPTKQSFEIASLLSIARNDGVIAVLALLQMTIHGLVDVPYFKNDLAILTWILLSILFSKNGFGLRPRHDTPYVSSTPPATPS